MTSLEQLRARLAAETLRRAVDQRRRALRYGVRVTAGGTIVDHHGDDDSE
jgi:hypothetical protein